MKSKNKKNWCEHVVMDRDMPIALPRRYVLMIHRPNECWSYVERWWKFCPVCGAKRPSLKA